GYGRVEWRGVRRAGGPLQRPAGKQLVRRLPRQRGGRLPGQYLEERRRHVDAIGRFGDVYRERLRHADVPDGRYFAESILERDDARQRYRLVPHLWLGGNAAWAECHLE